MFTGLVAGQGRVAARRRFGDEIELTVESQFDWDSPLEIGESIAVSGVCLTATSIAGPRTFSAYVSPETLRLTTLGSQDAVNLERALRLTDRLGGHLVSGHVDALTTLKSRTQAGRSLVLRFSLPETLSHLVAPKGSVAIDGVSLTVNEAGRDFFTLNIIPQTASVTTLSAKQPGQAFNLEVDLLARYLQRLLEQKALPQAASTRTSGLSIEELVAEGF
ncbi:MAG: riboflavin synthase [Deltaproteobacteria bacterium]|nr:riboflavin synthase [Deltaproteobacteria bacterium]